MTIADKKYESHPSWVLVGLHRCDGRVNLFNSPFASSHFVELTIKKATRESHLGEHWIHGREEIVSVRLSAVQFAQLITTMNVGDGVPGTLVSHWVDGQYTRVAQPPEEVHHELRHAVDEMHASIGKATDIDGLISDMERVLGNIKMSGANRDKIMAVLHQRANALRSSAPFYAKQAARAEVDAVVTRVLGKLGQQRLRELGVEQSLKAAAIEVGAAAAHEDKE